MLEVKAGIKGLSESEAQISRDKYGSNELSAKKRKTFWRSYLESFGDPIIRILLIALCVNLLFLFQNFNWYESVGIAAAVFLATFVSTLSEYGSESAFEKIQADAARIKCRVQRGENLVEIPISEIVVGDIVMMQSGERIPADGRIISGELSVDQSALNGESKEALKSPAGAGPVYRGQEESEFLIRDKLFRGSVVCSGEGVMRIECVGGDTIYGQLAGEIQEESGDSPLKGRLRDLARTISIFGYIAAAVVVVANLFNNIVIATHFDPILIGAYMSDTSQLLGDVLRALILGVTVIVMAVPEGLPMMITVVLSSNMKRMLKDNVLVRKLVGIETAGSLNILFTDKTGTLTRGKLEVVTFIDGGGAEYRGIPSMEKSPALKELLLLNCLYNNAAQIGMQDGKRSVIGGNSTDRALLRFIEGSAAALAKYEKGMSKPFDSRDKFSLCEIKGPRRMYLLKGAPEKLLPRCGSYCDENGRRRPLESSGPLARRMRDLAEDSVRLLALCVCENKPDPKNPEGLTLIGIIGIRDELRREVPAAIRQVTGAGVQVVMITGDNRETAVSIAKKAGLIREGFSPDAVITSTELAALDDDALKERLPHLRVIARALPSDKSRLVRISQELKLVAGMTGDGVNDAPALKKADVGFAMGSGAEIAKEASDIVILDNNFASIVKAILYGRTTFKSIRKFLILQLTENLCAVGVSVIGPFIGVDTPVTIIQILWINIFMDTLAGLAFAGEAPLPEYMKEPPKSRDEKIINPYMYTQILFTGMYTIVMCLIFLRLPVIREWFGGNEARLMSAFFALFMFAGVFNCFNARTYRMNLLSYIRRNKIFLNIMVLVVAIQIVLIYFGGAVFRTTALSFGELRLVVLMACTVILADLVRKMVLRMNYRENKSISPYSI